MRQEPGAGKGGMEQAVRRQMAGKGGMETGGLRPEARKG